MKRLLIAYVVSILFFGCKKPGCFETAGSTVSKTREITSFNRIELYDNVDLILTQDTIESIKIVAPEKIERNIITSLEDGILTIRNGTDCKWLRNPAEKPQVFVGVKKLEHLNYNGSGNVTSTNAITGDNITFYSATGAGNIEVTLDVKQLNASVEYESADFVFHGKANVCYCYTNSRGTLKIEDLVVKHLVIGHASVKDVTVNATEAIEATIYHTGNIYYKGQPPTILTTFYSTGRLYPVR